MSYGSPASFAAKLGPKLLTQLSAESGTVPSDPVIQGWLTSATRTVNAKVGTRYTTPVTGPADQLAQLEELEYAIALYRAWQYRGVNEQDNPAKLEMVNAIETLNAIAGIGMANPKLNLTGCAEQLVITTATSSNIRAGFTSELSHFDPPARFRDDRLFYDDDYWRG